MFKYNKSKTKAALEEEEEEVGCHWTVGPIKKSILIIHV
jgi:hypothetical protein